MSYFQFIVFSVLNSKYLKIFHRVFEQHNGAFSDARGDWRAARTPPTADEEVGANCVHLRKHEELEVAARGTVTRSHFAQ